MYKLSYLYGGDELDFTPIVPIPLEPPMNSVFPIISKLPPKPVINLGEYPRTSDFTPIVPITSEPATQQRSSIQPIIPSRSPIQPIVTQKTTGGLKYPPPPETLTAKPINLLTYKPIPEELLKYPPPPETLIAKPINLLTYKPIPEEN